MQMQHNDLALSLHRTRHKPTKTSTHTRIQTHAPRGNGDGTHHQTHLCTTTTHHLCAPTHTQTHTHTHTHTHAPRGNGDGTHHHTHLSTTHCMHLSTDLAHNGVAQLVSRSVPECTQKYDPHRLCVTKFHTSYHEVLL